MPHNYDFDKLSNISECEISPDGWINPITIIYGIGMHGELQSYFWKVKGTEHTFVIPIIRLDYLHQGDVKKHFKEVMEGFREDYKGWAEEKFYSDWMQKYKKQYKSFISL